jgi:hypothetical protein
LTKISVVSTFHKPVLDVYGQRFVDSFSKNIAPEIDLYLYAEDCNPKTSDPRIHVFDHHKELPQLVAFKDKWGNVPKANGKCPPEIKAKRPRDWHKEFKWDAVRFANKVYAVFDAAKKCDSDWLVWMDADTYVHSPFNYKAFKSFLPDRTFLSYLARGRKWPECGFYGINLKHSTGQKFLNDFEHAYEHAEYGIFQMEEWHDSYVFDEILKKVKKKNPNDATHNISGNIINGEGHPLINSGLGAYLDHMKGGRKFDGRSKQTDLVVTRTERYWQ